MQRIIELAKMVSSNAVKKGSLIGIETTSTIFIDGRTQFVVRLAKSLIKKNEVTQINSKEKVNPFLNPDPDLTVNEICGTHNVLLNKFSVVNLHLLLTTKQFEPQEQPLNQRDFTAIWTVLKEENMLCFFNCGPESGYSQPHKHIQVVPLPFIQNNNIDFPLESRLLDEPNILNNIAYKSNQLSFDHSIIKIDEEIWKQNDPIIAGQQFEINYLNCAKNLNWFHRHSYNFLMTRKCMWIVPRSKEKIQTLSVNALGFAGTFLVKTEQDEQLLRTIGADNLLSQVTFPKN
eukprot:TRINITY_DN7073_c0_g1_i1.p1 TRINITY_DN7073_c0_g1~~TRINITY_DN7073_c0_g1_i1.p1  ORF type:complete len:289 (-),score=121.34 TRINITY_DN7073_c0_g1_i1:43-909(-)